MVGKVSGVNKNTTIDDDSKSNDDDWLKQLAKKKNHKKNDELGIVLNVLSVGLQPSYSAKFTHGGLHNTKIQAMDNKNSMRSVISVTDANQVNKAESSIQHHQPTMSSNVAVTKANMMRNGGLTKFQSALEASSALDSLLQTGKKSAILSGLIKSDTGQRQSKASGEKRLPTHRLKDDMNQRVREFTLGKYSESGGGITSLNDEIKVTKTLDKQGNEKKNTIEERKNDSAPHRQEIPPLLGAVQEQVKHVNKEKASLTSQQLSKLQTTPINQAKEIKNNHTLELKYQFQQWSGEHSVNVSIPTAVHREANITLLPSDVRVEKALQNNIGNLHGFTSHFLRTQNEPDQQHRHPQRKYQLEDEDQE